MAEHNGDRIRMRVSEQTPVRMKAEPASRGITPEGTITITANGNYNVTNYAEAVVSVAVQKVLSGISVTSMPEKLVYDVGDALDLSGVTVTASYSDGTSLNVTASCAFVPEDGEPLGTVGEQGIEVGYGEGCLTARDNFTVTVNEVEHSSGSGTHSREWTESSRTLAVEQDTTTGAALWEYEYRTGISDLTVEIGDGI